MIRHFLSVSVLTLISRIFGYLRDVVIAFFFGAGLATDAFMAALRLPNLFRAVLAEGAMHAALIPMLSNIEQNKQQVSIFASHVMTWLCLVLALLNFLMYYYMPQVVVYLTPGYANNPTAINLITHLSYILFPNIVFSSLLALCGGLLHTYGNFWVFAAAPIIHNIAMIIGTFCSQNSLDYLAYATLIAGAIELYIAYYYVKKIGISLKLEFTLNKQIKLFFHRFSSTVLGSSMVQINSFISTIFASYTVGGISYLYYADRLYQLPLALIGTALATVLLPQVSQAVHNEEHHHVNYLTNLALQIVFLTALPISIVLWFDSHHLIGWCLEYGAFSAEHTTNTAKALAIYSLALPSFILAKLHSSLCFAYGNIKAPLYASIISVLINCLFSWYWLNEYGFLAVAMAAVVGTYLNNILLAIFTGKKYPGMNIQKLAPLFLLNTAIAFIIGAKQSLAINALLHLIIDGALILTFCGPVLWRILHSKKSI